MPFKCFLCHRQYGSNFNYKIHSRTKGHQRKCFEFIEKMKLNTCKLTVIEERNLKIAIYY